MQQVSNGSRLIQREPVKIDEQLRIPQDSEIWYLGSCPLTIATWRKAIRCAIERQVRDVRAGVRRHRARRDPIRQLERDLAGTVHELAARAYFRRQAKRYGIEVHFAPLVSDGPERTADVVFNGQRIECAAMSKVAPGVFETDSRLLTRNAVKHAEHLADAYLFGVVRLGSIDWLLVPWQAMNSWQVESRFASPYCYRRIPLITQPRETLSWFDALKDAVGEARVDPVRELNVLRRQAA